MHATFDDAANLGLKAASKITAKKLDSSETLGATRKDEDAFFARQQTSPRPLDLPSNTLEPQFCGALFSDIFDLDIQLALSDSVHD